MRNVHDMQCVYVCLGPKSPVQTVMRLRANNLSVKGAFKERPATSLFVDSAVAFTHS